MLDPKTASTPEEYIARLDEPRSGQIRALHDLIRATVPNLEPHIEAGMIGYGRYHYRYATGREGDWFVVGLASNKNYISLYVSGVADGQYVAESYKDRLPRANIGKSCVRFRKMEDLDTNTLRNLLQEGAQAIREWGLSC